MLLTWSYSVSADQVATEQSASSDLLNFFEARIRPVLIEHCYECHSTETESAGGLLLDARFSLRNGGDTGPAIVAGDSRESLLVRAMEYSDPQLQMPPHGKLPEPVVEDFRKWIDDGAEDPRADKPLREADSNEAQHSSAPADAFLTSHWAYQPLRAATTLEFGEASTQASVIDDWIHQKLSTLGLEAAGPAPPEVLARRLYFDLIGLPPTPEQLVAAREEILAGQLDKLVDRLLASNHYGEVQARRWMDVVRYADSITLRGFILPQAWRYRDYLIHSFNEDRSFATMIREQIAGDLMDSPNVQERSQQLIATAFMALGNTNLEKQNKLELEMDYLDEQMDVIGSAFLGMTIGCARCHDHKFDPISTKDYYALAGILRSSAGMKHANVSEWIELPLPLEESQAAYFEQLEQQQKSLKQEYQQLKKSAEKPSKSGDPLPIEGSPSVPSDKAQPVPPLSADEQLRTSPPSVQELEKQMATVAAALRKRPQYLTVLESGKPVHLPVHIRGSVHSLGEIVPRGFLTAIAFSEDHSSDSLHGTRPTSNPESDSSSPNRLDLANWIVEDSHPLAARVYANRIWQSMMGCGLVDSPNNFGTTGEKPSHPELLDWLAMRLMQSNWSTKSMIRAIVMTQAYQRSTDWTLRHSSDLDPENRSYWRGHSRRLTVESLRDAMLVISGELDTTMGGSLIRDGTANDFDYSHTSTRRSIYQPVFRNSLPQLYEQFDFADPSVSIGKRARSTHAMQGLGLANNPWVIERSKHAARHWSRLVAGRGLEGTVSGLLTSCFGRQPSAAELELSIQFLETQGSASPDDLMRWELLIQSLFASLDFRFLE